MADHGGGRAARRLGRGATARPSRLAAAKRRSLGLRDLPRLSRLLRPQLWPAAAAAHAPREPLSPPFLRIFPARPRLDGARGRALRSEEHTSELQSHVNLVCRLLLEKKKQ